MVYHYICLPKAAKSCHKRTLDATEFNDDWTGRAIILQLISSRIIVLVAQKKIPAFKDVGISGVSTEKMIEAWLNKNSNIQKKRS